MKERIEALMAEIEALSCKTEQEIEQARVRLLGKNSIKNIIARYHYYV